MERIGIAVGRSLATRASPGQQQPAEVQAARALMARSQASTMPALLDRKVDLELPRDLWDRWIEAGRPRTLRRPLRDDERALIEVRRCELEPWMLGYHPSELDDVVAALGNMYSGFPSMAGQSDVQAATRMDSIARRLTAYPLWAIATVCERIQTKGFVKRDGDRYVTERHWPPSDAEIIAEIEDEMKFYRLRYERVTALLTAQVTP